LYNALSALEVNFIFVLFVKLSQSLCIELNSGNSISISGFVAYILFSTLSQSISLNVPSTTQFVHKCVHNANESIGNS
jgi:hypothetical protein